MAFKQEITLEHGLDLSQVTTTGSILKIGEDLYDNEEIEDVELREVDFLGQPVTSFENFVGKMTVVDQDGYVKKKIIEVGGGKELHDGCTVTIAYSGYFEKQSEPFDVRALQKPLTVDLKENGLVPGLLMAVKSMLVGEVSVFHLTHQVMFGELGIPPRIKPRASCIFYIKLIRSIITPKEGPINYSEPNMFERIRKEVKLLYVSGMQLYSSKNYTAVIQIYKKAIIMLHKTRLADEAEEKMQQKLLVKFYSSLAICYNATKQPLRACTACNEVHRLINIWKQPKILYQNAKALRMIGAFDDAERRLKRAMALNPNVPEMEAEWEMLQKTRDTCNQRKAVEAAISKRFDLTITDEFKTEIDTLIKSFKENVNLCKLTLPPNLNTSEVEYIKKVCLRENVFCNYIRTDLALDKDDLKSTPGSVADDIHAIF